MKAHLKFRIRTSPNAVTVYSTWMRKNERREDKCEVFKININFKKIKKDLCKRIN